MSPDRQPASHPPGDCTEVPARLSLLVLTRRTVDFAWHFHSPLHVKPEALTQVPHIVPVPEISSEAAFWKATNKGNHFWTKIARSVSEQLLCARFRSRSQEIEPTKSLQDNEKRAKVTKNLTSRCFRCSGAVWMPQMLLRQRLL